MISNQELHEIIEKYKKIERGNTEVVTTDFFIDDLLPILVELQESRKRISGLEILITETFLDPEGESYCPLKYDDNIKCSDCGIRDLCTEADQILEREMEK